MAEPEPTGHLDDEPPPATGERFAELARLRNVRIESIVSSAEPEAVTYDQPHDEWVVVLDGEAHLDVDGTRRTLRAGDWLVIPARTTHCVLHTAAGTRWLAVHVDDPNS